MTRFGRRRLLGAALLGMAGCDGHRTHEGFLGAMERWNDGAQRLLFRKRKLAREEPDSALTPYDAFPVYYIGDGVPEAPEGWRLRVKGLCARPLSLSVDDLRKLPRADLRVRHYCVEGWSAVASWHGVRVSEIARACGADPRARFVEFRSFDAAEPDEGMAMVEDAPATPYYSCWDRESAEHPQTLLAYGMNGRDLLPAHGAPVRLYSSVKLGYKMVNYLTEVIFQPVRTGGYWEDQGYEWFAGV
jgi:DMSO/TMAO reductase YedYZ molybdopterin-dependent catalytic subunit